MNGDDQFPAAVNTGALNNYGRPSGLRFQQPWWKTLAQDPWYITGAKALLGEREVEEMRRGEVMPWVQNVAMPLIFSGRPRGGLGPRIRPRSGRWTEVGGERLPPAEEPPTGASPQEEATLRHYDEIIAPRKALEPKSWGNIYERKYSGPLRGQEWADLYATPDVEFTVGGGAPNVKLPRGTHAGPLPPEEQNALIPGTEGWYDPRTGKLLPGNKELIQKWNQLQEQPKLTTEDIANAAELPPGITKEKFKNWLDNLPKPPEKEPPKFYPPGDTDRPPSGFPPWWLTLQRFQTPFYA